jgi:hypothetical protein
MREIFFEHPITSAIVFHIQSCIFFVEAAMTELFTTLKKLSVM